MLVPSNSFFTERNHSSPTRGLGGPRTAAKSGGGILASLQEMMRGATGTNANSSGIGIGDALLATSTRCVVNPVVPIFLSASLDSTEQLLSSVHNFNASSKDFDLISGQPLIARVIEQHIRTKREAIMAHYVQQERAIRSLLTNIEEDEFVTYQSTILFAFNDLSELRAKDTRWKDRPMPRGDHPYVTLWVKLMNIKSLPGANINTYNYDSDEDM